VRRLLRRALLLFGAYVALLATIGVAGFLGSAVVSGPRFSGELEFSPGSSSTDADASSIAQPNRSRKPMSIGLKG